MVAILIAKTFTFHPLLVPGLMLSRDLSLYYGPIMGIDLPSRTFKCLPAETNWSVTREVARLGQKGKDHTAQSGHSVARFKDYDMILEAPLQPAN